MKIGVIGNGFVGHAMTLLTPGVDVIVWDVDSNKRVPRDLTFKQFVQESEIVFVAVPTPMNKDGSCHVGVVEHVVEQVRSVDSEKYIVIRSTVPPGTSDRLGVFFMPEFLTEREWRSDFTGTDEWIVGADDKQFISKIQEMFTLAADKNCIAGDHVKQTTTTEAEMIKYTRNCFLASKVSFFNEIYQLCKKIGIDYEAVRHECGGDVRIGHQHTYVPGPDGKLGYGGTCFPKDTNALRCIMQEHDIESPVIDSVVFRNETIDRTEKDWKSDKGRAVL